MLRNIRIQDKTGNVRMTLFGDNAVQFQGLNQVIRFRPSKVCINRNELNLSALWIHYENQIGLRGDTIKNIEYAESLRKWIDAGNGEKAVTKNLM